MESADIQSVRVGDAERQAVTEVLGEHYAAGRLTRAEHDDRVAAALAARTRADLDGLQSDLPAPAAGPGRAPASARLPGARAPRPAPGSPAHLARTIWWTTGLLPWAVMSVVFVLIWALTGAGYFWPVWPITGWGVGVGATGILAHRLPEAYLRRQGRRGPGGSALLGRLGDGRP